MKSKKQELLEREKKILIEIISETLKTKISFFKEDIFENNKRLYLNFGHTFAHSIEMATEKLSGKEIIRHGEAVGIGMLCEIFLANKKKNQIFILTEDLLEKYNLPSNLNNLSFKFSKQKFVDEIYKGVFLDKKKIIRYPRYISLRKIYQPRIEEIEDTVGILETIKLLT